MSAAPDPWAFSRWAYEMVTGNPNRKAVLMMLATLADHTTGRCEAKVSTIVKATELGERTVRTHLGALEDAGVIDRRPQYRVDGGRRGDEYLLRAPWVDGWPDGTPLRQLQGGGAATGEAPLQTEGEQERPPRDGHAPGQARRAHAREAAQQVPDDFPDELRPHAKIVMRVLRDVARQHNAREVTARGVALAMMAHPRHPLVASAYAFASWAADPPRPIRDVVASYRTWLSRERPLASTERLDDEGAGGVPATVTPLRPRGGGGAQAQRDAVTEQLLRDAGRLP